MPDTPSNQKAFGYPPGQAPGCGFPTLAFVGVFCLVRAAFEAGDILLADRGFCCYVEMALMQKRGGIRWFVCIKGD